MSGKETHLFGTYAALVYTPTYPGVR